MSFVVIVVLSFSFNDIVVDAAVGAVAVVDDDDEDGDGVDDDGAGGDDDDALIPLPSDDGAHMKEAATSSQMQNRPFTCVRWWQLAIDFADKQACIHPLAAGAVARFRSAVFDEEAGAMRIIRPIEAHLRLWDHQVSQFLKQLAVPWDSTLHVAADYAD